MLSINEIKQKVGQEASKLVKQNMTIGIGSGSTVAFFIEALGERVNTGLHVKAIPTSEQTRLLASQKRIDIIDLNEAGEIDLTIDGADEIDSQLQLIKGGGGALLQEKIVAAASQQLVIIADHTKLVPQLGLFPLPVEVIPFAWEFIRSRIQKSYSIKAELRKKDDTPYSTDHDHYILDCYFQKIYVPEDLNDQLHRIPGVVETGLFINMAERAFIGYPDGSIKQLKK